MKRRLLLILSALAILFASCGNKGGNSGLMVPDDAAMVMHVNGSSLSSKLSWEEIRQSAWFKLIAKGTDDTMKQKFLENPGSTGMDTKSDIIMYMKKHGRGSYMIVAGSLTDADAFEKFNKYNNKKAEAKKESGFRYMQSEEDDDGVVVWDKSHFAYISNAGLPAGSFMGKANYYRSNEFRNDSLLQFGITALTLKSSDNLDKDDRFGSLVKDGRDIHMWMNMAEFYSGMEMALPMMQPNTIFKDNVMTVSVNFDNGKISAKGKQYYNEAMSKILANYKAKPVSADIINRIPSANVVGVMAFNFSPEGMKEIFRLTNMDAVAEMMLGQVGFNTDDLIKATNGEMLLAFSDPGQARGTNSDEDGHEKTKIMPDINVLFATSINDKGAFEKLATFVWDMRKNLEKSSEAAAGMIPDIYTKVENNWFVASTSADMRDKFLVGNNNKHAFADKITGHPIGIYVDLQKIGAGRRHGGDSSRAAMWQDIVITGGDFKDGALQFDAEVNLLDKNTNSLKQLNLFIDKMFTQRARISKWMPDPKLEGIKEPADDSDEQ